MGPIVEHFPSDPTLPKQVDVVIAGGGIIGLSTALALADRGVSVLVCEKGGLAGEQSSRNWGWCRQMGRDPRELPLILESMRIWRGLNTRTGSETGFRTAGILYLADNEAEMAKHSVFLEYARPYQIQSRLIDSRKVSELLPGAGRTWFGALYTSTDGRAEPQLANTAIARAARQAGAVIVTNCAVRGFETEAGRVARVVTERGAVRCSSFVLAGGAWSRLFARRHNTTLPQLKVISSVFRTTPVSGGPDVSTSGNGFAFRKRLDGGYTVAHGSLSVAPVTPDSVRFFPQFLPAFRMERKYLRLRAGRFSWDEARQPVDWRLDETSPFERNRTLDPRPVIDILALGEQNLKAAFPVMAGARIAQAWAGAIDVTPDAVPVISGVDKQPGFFIATGFSGHGFGIGPGAGQLMADLVTGSTPVVDPSPYRFSRFSDGTKPEPIAGY